MKLRDRADRVAKSVFSALQTSPDADRTKAATDVIEKTGMQAVARFLGAELAKQQYRGAILMDDLAAAQ